MNNARIDNYLKDYAMYENNIQFRICSTRAIEKWKNVQAFQLNEITNGRFFFQPNRKELLLLLYDLLSRLISEVENWSIEILKDHADHIVQKEHVDDIDLLATMTLDVYNDVITRRKPDSFDQEYYRIWWSCNAALRNLTRHRLKGLEGYSFELAFPNFVDILITTMQHVLFEIHELNCFFTFFNEESSSTPFLAYTPLDRISIKLTGESLMTKRVDTIIKNFDVREVYVKNNSTDRVPPSVYESIEEKGVKINYKLNF